MKKSKSSQGRKTLNSFEELRKEFGLKEINFQTKNKKKLESQRENFKNHHLCPICKTQMNYIEGTNVMICTNPDCKGIEREVYDEELEDIRIEHDIPSHQLDQKGAKIAYNIFK